MKKLNKQLDLNKIIGYFINRDDRFLKIKLERDWKVMLACFFSAVLFVFGLCGYIFWKNYSESLPDEYLETKEKDVLTFKKSEMKSILEKFDKRIKNYDNILTNPHEIKDPSI